MKPDQRQHAEEMTVVDDGLILALWQTRKFDTVEIAKQRVQKLHKFDRRVRGPSSARLFEWQVANRLFHIREAMR